MTNIAREILVSVIEAGRLPSSRSTRGVTASNPAAPVAMIGINAFSFNSTSIDISPST